MCVSVCVEGEEREVDQSAYEMLHSVNMEWPALSFDIIADALGDNRTTVCILSLSGAHGNDP